MIVARLVAVVLLAALAFGGAYLLSSSDASTAATPGTMRVLPLPAPAVTLPDADPGTLPALARPPRPKPAPSKSTTPVQPGPTAPTGPALPPAPQPPPPPPSGGGGGGDIIEG